MTGETSHPKAFSLAPFRHATLRVALFVLLAAILLPLGSRWHVSSQDDVRIFRQIHVVKLLERLDVSPSWMPDFPIVVVKSRLGALDALVNVFSIFVFSITVLPLGFLAALVGLVWGVVTADWNVVILGILSFLIVGFAALLLPIGILLVLLFQTGTPAYFLILLALGLPAVFLALKTQQVFIIGPAEVLIVMR